MVDLKSKGHVDFFYFRIVLVLFDPVTEPSKFWSRQFTNAYI